MIGTATLERMVWRHEYGQASSSALEAGFNAERSYIDDAFAAVQNRLDIVRQHDAGLLGKFDDCRNAFGQALDGGQWRTCLHQMRKTARHLSAVRDLLAAHEAIAAVEADAAILRRVVPDVGPYRLTSVETATALVAAARECMNEHAYLKARSIGDFAAAYIKPLLVRTAPSPDTLRSFTDRIERLTEICNEVAPVAVATAELIPGPLQHAMRDGWVDLSLRLLGELERQAASRAQLASALFDLSQVEPKLIARDMKRLSGQRSFEAAARYVRRRTIESVANSSKSLNIEIESLIGAWNGKSDTV